MKKVLFICTANVCGSRLGQGLFNALAEDRSPPVRAEITETAALGGALYLTYDRLEAQTVLVLAAQLDVMPRG